MGIYLDLVDHDKMFNETTIPPIIVNEFNLESQEDMDYFNNLVYTTYSGDNLEVLPQCNCGETHDESNIGVVCPECGTPCLPVTERPLESALWINAPEGIPALINPAVWIILEPKLTVSRVSILQYLTNPMYQIPTDKIPDAIRKLQEHNVPRGLAYFINHFDEIMSLLINEKVITKGSLAQRQQLMEFIETYRDRLFSNYVPVPSKLAIITENSTNEAYVDEIMKNAVQAVRAISSIENSAVKLKQGTVESRTVKAIEYLSLYYSEFYRKNLGRRTGWFRKHYYGSRMRFSFRGVISSISKPHRYDQVILPWGMACFVLRHYIMGKLMRRGMTPDEAVGHINEHTLQYSPILDEIFQEIIAEWPGGRGISCAIQRNPSLTRGSLQLLYVNAISTNVKVNTIQLSVLILDAYNKSLLLLAETSVE